MSIDVPGAEPAGAERPAQPSSASAVNRDILESLTGLVKHVGGIAHAISGGFGIAPHDLLAMFKMDGPLSMKELAQRMGCDASFVTAVADTLEAHGFARREASQRDRRVKNLVLTPEGIIAKERLMASLAERMPWCHALDDAERQCFLGLLRKMLDAERGGAAAGTRASEAGRATARGEAGPDPGAGGPDGDSRTRSD